LPVTPDPTAAARAGSTYRLALLLLVVGGGLAFLAYGQTWVTVTTAPAGLPATTVTVSGRELDPTAGYLPLLLLAAVLAVWATSGWLRRIVGVIAALAAVVVTVGALRASPPWRGAITTPDGVVVAAGGYQAGLWWLLAALGGVLALVGAVLVAWRGPGWSTMARRYERAPGPADSPLTDRATWDLLDAGVDPTVDPTVDPGVDPTAGPGEGPTADAASDPPGTMPGQALPGAPHEEGRR
jgi:uncharacterized membrane protein (TIGR02234 family)